MQVGEHEPGPSGCVEAHDPGDTEHHCGREQYLREKAGGAAGVPQQHHGFPTPTGSGAGHPATARTSPLSATSRAGSPRRVNQAGAAVPSTTDAVLAMLASTQLAAVTLTVRQPPVA